MVCESTTEARSAVEMAESVLAELTAESFSASPFSSVECHPRIFENNLRARRYHPSPRRGHCVDRLLLGTKSRIPVERVGSGLHIHRGQLSKSL